MQNAKLELSPVVIANVGTGVLDCPPPVVIANVGAIIDRPFSRCNASHWVPAGGGTFLSLNKKVPKEFSIGERAVRCRWQRKDGERVAAVGR